VIGGIYKAVKSRRVVKLPAFDKEKRPSLRQEIRKQPHGKPETVDVTPPSGKARLAHLFQCFPLRAGITGTPDCPPGERAGVTGYSEVNSKARFGI
jgi:hypothetical protein